VLTCCRESGIWGCLADLCFADYDEEDDGFTFKRVKKKPVPKPIEEQTQPQPEIAPAPVEDAPESAVSRNDIAKAAQNDETTAKPKARRKRMSFSTPKPQKDPPRRRSKRLSKDNEEHAASPTRKDAIPGPQQLEAKAQPDVATKSSPRKARAAPVEDGGPSKATSKDPPVRPASSKHTAPNIAQDEQTQTIPTQPDDHSSTRIALPLADTPVIKRNKAMREGKSGKGERRSSLGSRGRRASSLIESGGSNGKSVAVADGSVADICAQHYRTPRWTL
jgi:kinetochore protein Mis13/DSN1